MANTAVINPRRHQLLRTRISQGENIVCLVIIVAMAATVGWIFTTRDDYDPAFRDINPELLTKPKSERTLYVPPLKLLADPNAPPAANAPVAALGPFPVAIVSEGWSLASRVRQFTTDTLFEKINGEAPKFTKQGFQSLSYVVVASAETDEEIGIELFDQGDRGGSLGIFSDHRSSDSNVESTNGVDYFTTSIGAIGRRGRFFFRIIGDADTDSVRRKAVQIVTALGALPAESESVEPGMALLTNRLGIDPKLISFQKANVFKFDFASDFWFGTTNEETSTRIFAHESTSPDDARALHARLVEDLAFDFETIDEDIGRSVLLHGFLKNYFAVGLSGNWVYGIENAASLESAHANLDRFSDVLGGE